MIFLMDPEFWARLFGIVIIDLTLAGDNALVIALAVRTLPPRQQFWGRVWGAAGAGGVRLALLARPPLLLPLPMLQPFGGLLLLLIAFKLCPQETGAANPAARGGALLPLLPGAAIIALGWWFSTQNGRKKVPGQA